MGNDDSKKSAKRNSNQTESSTRVDLGDDLIASAIIGPKNGGAPATHSPQDQYENAKILMNEDFVEDAKKVLRKILISDPRHAAARESLQEILNREMKDLLADRDSPIQRPRLFERKGKTARGPQSTSEDVLRDLENEFGLGSEQAPTFTLDADVNGTTETDRIDLGIAFMEMGLYPQAIMHLSAAIELLERQLEPSTVQRISATALLGRAYLLGDRPYDTVHLLHAILRDAEIPPNDKIEFFYLMGVAYEKIGDRKAALPWYGKVRDLDPQYRDIQERLRKPIA